jgi:hypothetical protein
LTAAPRLYVTGDYILHPRHCEPPGRREAPPDDRLYALFLILLVAVFALRMFSMAARPAPRTVQAQ